MLWPFLTATKPRANQLQALRTPVTFICRSLGIAPGPGFTHEDQHHPRMRGGGGIVPRPLSPLM